MKILHLLIWVSQNAKIEPSRRVASLFCLLIITYTSPKPQKELTEYLFVCCWFSCQHFVCVYVHNVCVHLSVRNFIAFVVKKRCTHLFWCSTMDFSSFFVRVNFNDCLLFAIATLRTIWFETWGRFSASLHCQVVNYKFLIITHQAKCSCVCACAWVK